LIRYNIHCPSYFLIQSKPTHLSDLVLLSPLIPFLHFEVIDIFARA
jgi:hypothetical protein